MSLVVGKAKKHGALLYPVEGQCGPLPSSSYAAGKELACAICKCRVDNHYIGNLKETIFNGRLYFNIR